MGKAWRHFKTITYHKLLVAEGCFKVGLYRQGILHDLSKYSPAEFMVGVRYFQGTRSPNNAEREQKGYSAAWMHHKGRNRHHYEYWTDYSSAPGEKGYIVPVPMPDRYVAEMVMDRIAASKVYKGKDYTDSSPLEYYLRGRAGEIIHPETAKKLERTLRLLAREGEDRTFAHIRRELAEGRRRKLPTVDRHRHSAKSI